ncbi:hypothetical protein GCM10022416_00580 [Actinomadura keratinilytica]|jgi:hypothetical protein|uniref:Uncharacterized protein n=1 Tax=Actinomadura keratinilytica TaxID=547461 RepID=A0ABP7XWG3_9ACTN
MGGLPRWVWNTWRALPPGWDRTVSIRGRLAILMKPDFGAGSASADAADNCAVAANGGTGSIGALGLPQPRSHESCC